MSGENTHSELKVLLVIPSFSSLPTGNQARMNDVLKYARQYDGDVDYDIVPLVLKSSLADSAKQRVHFRGGARIERALFTLCKTLQKRSEVDIIHITGFPPVVGSVASLIAVGKPLVVGPNIAGKVPPRSLLDRDTWQVIRSEKPRLTRRWSLYGEGLERAKFQILQSRAYPSAAFLSFSHHMADLLEERGVNRDDITVLSSGVSTETFHPPETDDHEPSSPPELLSVGAPNRLKGLPTLVEAVDRLVESGVDVRVTVAGADAPPDYLGERSVLKEHFRFVGYVPRESLSKYYQSADIFVTPSYYELESTVLIEALACGTPCIATDDPSFREIGEPETCRYFQKGSPQGLAEAVQTVIADYSRYSRVARANAHSYDISNTYQDLVKVYEDVLAEHVI